MQDWTDPDRAYSNGAFIAGSEAYPTRWASRSAAFREQLGDRARLGIAYGPAPRNAFDLFLPQSRPRGLLVFIHGGYWMSFSRDSWSYLAEGAVTRGWACCLPSYTLAPDATIPAMTREIAAAVSAAAAMVPGPLVVTGHSAGGHLAARMACADGPPGVSRVVPISPLAELEPLMQTKMQETLRLTLADCAAESPARLVRRPETEAHVWVGGQERPSFLWQARVLSEAWSCPWTASPGRQHFDVIDELAEAVSPLTETCLGGLEVS